MNKIHDVNFFLFFERKTDVRLIRSNIERGTKCGALKVKYPLSQKEVSVGRLKGR